MALTFQTTKSPIFIVCLVYSFWAVEGVASNVETFVKLLSAPVRSAGGKRQTQCFVAASAPFWRVPFGRTELLSKPPLSHRLRPLLPSYVETLHKISKSRTARAFCSSHPVRNTLYSPLSILSLCVSCHGQHWHMHLACCRKWGGTPSSLDWPS
jgi:hypothetical protein